MAVSDAPGDWQRAWSAARPHARIRQRNADFRVTEVLDFEFAGDGEHDYLWLEKDGANTAWVAGQLAAFAGIAARDVGYAGMKDRHAVTRQWFSVRRPAGEDVDWQRLDLDGVTLLDLGRHRRKLRRGAHRANRFVILLRLDSTASADEPTLALIRERGVPNYFGEQRFGIAGGNLELAAALARGERLSRSRRGFAISAGRSLLFNEMLARRVAERTWDELLEGDRASLDGSGSHFAVPVVDAELAERCARGDLHPSGELWGEGSPSSSGVVAMLEKAVAERHRTLAAVLERRCAADRRPLRALVRDLQWTIDARGLELRFELTRGSYATAVLREIADYAFRTS